MGASVRWNAAATAGRLMMFLFCSNPVKEVLSGRDNAVLFEAPIATSAGAEEGESGRTTARGWGLQVSRGLQI
jgi:hypothetical protein